MGNISDNLRDFPERPKDVQCWKKREELYSTLSVILNFQENNGEVITAIKNLQNEIIEQLSGMNIFHNPYITNGLYKYPENTFHFSLINSLKYDVPDEGNFKNFEGRFQKFRNSINQDNGYKETIGNIKNNLSKNLLNNLPIGVEAELRWIHCYEDKAIDTFSLQVFPGQIFIKRLKEIKKEIEKMPFKVSSGAIDIKLKAYPEQAPRRFTLNILRFIAFENLCPLTEDDKLRTINVIERINRRHNDNPLKKFKITRLSLVESDPFLFNDDPEIEKYFLK